MSSTPPPSLEEVLRKMADSLGLQVIPKGVTSWPPRVEPETIPTPTVDVLDQDPWFYEELKKSHSGDLPPGLRRVHGTLFTSEDAERLLKAVKIREGSYAYRFPHWSGENPKNSMVSFGYAEQVLDRLNFFHGRWVVVRASMFPKNMGRVGFARMMIPHEGHPFHPVPAMLMSSAESVKSLPARIMVTFNVPGYTGKKTPQQLRASEDFACYPVRRVRQATENEVRAAFTENEVPLRSWNLPHKLIPVIGDADIAPPSTQRRQSLMAIQAALKVDFRHHERICAHEEMFAPAELGTSVFVP